MFTLPPSFRRNASSLSTHDLRVRSTVTFTWKSAVASAKRVIKSYKNETEIPNRIRFNRIYIPKVKNFVPYPYPF